MATCLALWWAAAPATEPARYDPQGSAPLSAPFAAPKAGPGETVEVTLLVGYTATVERRRGRRLSAFIEELVDYTNETFERSRIPARLRLVGTARTTYRETRDPERDFYRLFETDDGHADDLHVRRDELEADLVILLVEADPGQECGMAFLIEPGFSDNDRYAVGVVAHQWAARNGNWESCFTHEIGHLFSAHHAPDNASGPAAPDGHGLCHRRNPRFHTAMVYNNRPECRPAIGHFSNPDVLWRGVPTGTVERHNNARVMTVTARELAEFRGEPLPEVNRHALSYHAISPSRPGATGFVRIENFSDRAGTVAIQVSDDAGDFYPPFNVDVGPLAVTTMYLSDIAAEIGETEGAWVLHSESTLHVRGAAYAFGPYWLARTDVLLSAHHDVPNTWTYRPRPFNPASNLAKRSVLHLRNPFANDVEVTITARDDAGRESDAPMVFTLPSGWAGRTVTAEELEAVWGDGHRKWRPEIRATGELHVVNLIVGADGFIASLPPVEPACRPWKGGRRPTSPARTWW
jgi:hypothetical protein